MKESETMTAEESAAPDTFVGYGPAARYLGLKRNTLSSYVTRGIGPKMESERAVDGQYNLPVFTRAALDLWIKDRPGQGARTDLAPPAV